MSSRCLRPEIVALAVVAGLIGACEREDRQSRGDPLPESGPAENVMTTIRAGDPTSPPPGPDPRAGRYEGNALEVSEGQRLFRWFNCSGCHAHGGGGSGPALMDAHWRYGGRFEQIYATILEGRPNGMPSFRGRITEEQGYQLAAYVRSLSGNVSKDIPAARPDEMSATPPATRTAPQPPEGGDVPSASQGSAQ